MVNKVVIPTTSIGANTKSTLTSLLTANTNNAAANKTFIGTRRIFMTKGADGTTRMITGPTSILPKAGTAGGQQSLIKLQTPSGQTLQTIPLQQGAPQPGNVLTDLLKTFFFIYQNCFIFIKARAGKITQKELN